MALILNIVISISLIVYIAYSLTQLLKRTISPFYKTYFVLFSIMHFGVALGFAYFLNDLTTINDPQDFYIGAKSAENWFSLFGIGHDFMSFIIYPFVKYGVSIEVLFLLFATISFKGFLIYFDLLKVNENVQKRKIFLLLFFLIPSIHFWTGFLGKDPLLFFLMALVLQKVSSRAFNLKLILLFIPIFLIRPHVFFVLMLSFMLFFMLNSKRDSSIQRKVVLGSILVFSILAPIFLIYFLKMENLSFVELSDYYKGFMEYATAKGNTSISLSETNIFTRIFYITLMPLPFLYPLNNPFLVFVSLENIYYLILFIFIFFYFLKNKLGWINITDVDRFALISGIALLILFSSYLYNLGLGNRMRIMFYPYLFYFLNSNINIKFNMKK